MRYKACIFDLDGTLCDSVESIASSANRALKDFGLKEASLEQYRQFVGEGVDVLIHRLLRYNEADKETVFQEVKERYLSYFEEGCVYRVVPYPGILEMLEALKKEGAKLAVLSNKPHKNTEKVIRGVFGENCFDEVLGYSQRFLRKPDPSAAFFLAEEFGVLPAECVYVGDTATDMKTGKAAGMKTIGVEWGFRGRAELEQNGADHVIEHPLELLTIFDRDGMNDDKTDCQ